jgi:hypothetical protein
VLLLHGLLLVLPLLAEVVEFFVPLLREALHLLLVGSG